jgi:hypothetical protein
MPARRASRLAVPTAIATESRQAAGLVLVLRVSESVRSWPRGQPAVVEHLEGAF